MHTGWPQTDRTERKIEEVAMLVRANRSQTVDDLAAAVGVSHGTCFKILTDDLNMSRVTQHSVPRILRQRVLTMIRTFLNRIILQTKHGVSCMIRN